MLYVKNLKSLVTEDELRQVFEPYGQVGRVKKTKDYGFIHFENREDALRAMEELNGTVSSLLFSHCCLARGSHISWKVVEFKKGIFQPWKVMESDCGHGIPPIDHGIF